MTPPSQTQDQIPFIERTRLTLNAHTLTSPAGPAAAHPPHGFGVLVALATRGGQRLVTYLRLAQVKPPSRLPLSRI